MNLIGLKKGPDPMTKKKMVRTAEGKVAELIFPIADSYTNADMGREGELSSVGLNVVISAFI